MSLVCSGNQQVTGFVCFQRFLIHIQASIYSCWASFETVTYCIYHSASCFSHLIYLSCLFILVHWELSRPFYKQLHPISLHKHIIRLGGFPDGACGKEPACQCRRHKRCGFHPWIGERRRAWQPTHMYLTITLLFAITNDIVVNLLWASFARVFEYICRIHSQK